MIHKKHSYNPQSKVHRFSKFFHIWSSQYTLFHKKTGPFVISSYLCFDSCELHEIFQKYIGGAACCENGINVCDSLTTFANIVIMKWLKIIMRISTKQDLFECRTSVYVTIKLSINSKSCTTFTTDGQNVRRLQWHNHGGAYATASLRCRWHAGLGVPTL